MRIVACGLIAGTALLGAAPAAIADESAEQSAPQAEVSMLAVSLTVGGAIATVGSGVALTMARRRKVSPPS